jgi:hypothetical protein
MPTGPKTISKLVIEKMLSRNITKKSKSLAVRAKCLQCKNGDWKEISLCQEASCALNPVRPYQVRQIKSIATLIKSDLT